MEYALQTILLANKKNGQTRARAVATTASARIHAFNCGKWEMKFVTEPSPINRKRTY